MSFQTMTPKRDGLAATVPTELAREMAAVLIRKGALVAEATAAGTGAQTDELRVRLEDKFQVGWRCWPALKMHGPDSIALPSPLIQTFSKMAALAQEHGVDLGLPADGPLARLVNAMPQPDRELRPWEADLDTPAYG